MADPRRKIFKEKKISTDNLRVESAPTDPLYFITLHPKKPTIIDLNCFASGLCKEDMDARVRGTSVPFRGRPKLIFELSAAIRELSVNYSKPTVSALFQALRWWWRFLDKLQGICADINGVADFNETHFAAYRLAPCRNGYASLFFRILDRSRQNQNDLRQGNDQLAPLNWVAVATASIEHSLVSQIDVQRIYNHLKHRGFSILAEYEVCPDRAPTKAETLVFFTLFILKTGWNPSTAYELNATQNNSSNEIDCVVKHPINALFCFVKSIKERAGGQIQFALSSNKPLLSPSNIVKTMCRQTTILRGQVLKNLDSALLKKNLVHEQGGNVREINQVTELIAELRHMANSPWLYSTGKKTATLPFGEIRELSEGVTFLKDPGSAICPAIKGPISHIDADRQQIVVNGSFIHFSNRIDQGKMNCVENFSVGDSVSVYGSCDTDEVIRAKKIIVGSSADLEICITGLAGTVKLIENVKRKRLFIAKLASLKARREKISVSVMSAAIGESAETINRQPWMLDSIRHAKLFSSDDYKPLEIPFISSFKINGIHIELQNEEILNVIRREQLASNRTRVRVSGKFVVRDNVSILVATSVDVLLAWKGNSLTLWAKEINRSLQFGEQPVSENIDLSDLRDAFITWSWKYRNSWLDAMLASGHRSKESLNHYLNKRQHKEDSRRDFLKVTNSLWQAIDVKGLNFPLGLATAIAALTASVDERQLARWAEGRDKTYAGTGCLDFNRPPKRIAPEHIEGLGCRIHRCTLCPHAILLPDSAHLLARRMAELAHIQSIIPMSMWTDADYADELFNTELALKNYPIEQVDAKISFWKIEISEGRHFPMLAEGSYV